MQKIAEANPTGASVSFTGIPQGYNSLRVVLAGRGSAAAASTTVTLSFNGDTTAAHYAYQYAYGTAAIAGAAEDISDPGILAGGVTAASGVAGDQGVIIVDIPNYAGTTYSKAAIVQNIRRETALTGGMFTIMLGGFWISGGTAAINRVDLVLASGNFVAGTTATLYGLP